MHKITKAPLPLCGLARCFLTEKHLPSVNVVRKRQLCSGNGGDLGKNEVYDVIISGGGMVGSTMACSLGEWGSLDHQWHLNSIERNTQSVIKTRYILTPKH